jgi:hypothetical protein
MSDPEKSEKKSNSKASNIEDKDSKKIWITLPVEYSDILDILAGDAPERIRSNRKSVVIEKMIDDYIKLNQDTLKVEGKWQLIMNAKKKTIERYMSGEKIAEEMITSLDQIISRYPDLEEQYVLAKALQDVDGIKLIYDSIFTKYKQIQQQNSL